jgi:hypothetical protein
VAAAWLYAVDPFSKRFATLILTEGLAPLLVVAALLAFVKAVREGSYRWWGTCGALAAALTLVRPFFVIAIPLIAAAALFRAETKRRDAFRLLAAAACAALVLGPWLARNATVVGRPVISTWGFGINLLLAARGEGLHRPVGVVQRDPAFLADRRKAAPLAASPSGIRDDPDARARSQLREDEALRDTALSVYERRLRHAPFDVAGEWLYRAYFLWQAHADRVQYPAHSAQLLVLRVLDWLTVALAIAGVSMAIRIPGAGRAAGAFVVIYTAVSAVMHVEPRYSDPLRGLLLGFVALALVQLVLRVRQRSQKLPAR